MPRWGRSTVSWAQRQTPRKGIGLRFLVTLVEAYEAGRWPVEPPDPVAMIEHAMEAHGYRQEGPRRSNRLAAACLGSAEPPTAVDPADDPRSVGEMEYTGRRARARVRPRALDA